MKKCIFLVFVLFFGSFFVIAQTRPIMGYDKVAWGVSVAEVRKVYNISEDIPATVDPNDDPNIIKMTQENVSDSITSRTFIFNDDKLYRVWVYYKDWSDSTKNNLQSVLENRFGKATDFDTKTQQTMLAFQTVYYRTNTTVFGRYSPDLYIEMIQGVLYTSGWEMDTMNLLGQNQLTVCYTWKKFRDEYQASKLGL
jgi:hypothetical protein